MDGLVPSGARIRTSKYTKSDPTRPCLLHLNREPVHSHLDTPSVGRLTTEDTLHTLQPQHLYTSSFYNPNQLKFIPANKQLDINLNIPFLRAAYHPIDIAVIKDKEVRTVYLHPARLQHIRIPGILQACHDTT